MDLRILLLASLLIASSQCAVLTQSISDITNEAKPLADASTTAAAPNTTTAAPNTTTTEPPKPTPPATTTPAPITTESTTTPAPTTTKSTTTPAPITTKSTTTPAPITTKSTTTPVPITTQSTTTAEPPTTVAPTPAPVPQPSFWYLQEGNVTCVVVKMLASVNVTYPVVNSTNTVTVPILGNVNGTAIKGSCNKNGSQILDIPIAGGHKLELVFEVKDDIFDLANITLTVNATALPNSTATGNVVYLEKKPLFPTHVTLSYKCSKVQDVNLTSSANITSVLSVSQLQLQAFRTTPDNQFSQALDCASMDTPDIVPIAVGVSLGVMILIVLVAYLIGRRRSQDGGYVSM